MSERFGNQPPGEESDPRRGFPRATYRLQFNREFTLAQGEEIAEYLRDLGISDCYSSPLFKAGPQSTHGYDVCGFDQISLALGGRSAFKRFAATLRDLGMGLVLDMVPNHMGASAANEWWVDVLEHGPASPYASWFDIEWRPPLDLRLQDKVLLPVLEDHYSNVLESGKLTVVLEDGAFELAYYDRRFPIAARSYPALLRPVLASAVHAPNAASLLAEFIRVSKVLDSRNPPHTGARTEFAELKRQFGKLCREAPSVPSAMESALAQLNGRVGEPRSFDGLHALLQEQHYRLAYWRVAREELNYRRFFDVTELVSLRMELPEVFQTTHESLLGWLREDNITGLRIDHPDGLWDPKEYLERLQSVYRTGFPGTRSRLYIVVEKILKGDESLPSDWPVAGTTGYDFLNRVNALFVDPSHRTDFDALYRDFTGCPEEFEGIVYASKKKILQELLVSEFNSLAYRLNQVCRCTRYGQDFTREQLRTALSAVIAAFPVYRTYAQVGATKLDARDRHYCEQAVQAARKREPALEAAVFDFIQNVLLLRVPGDLDEEGRQLCREFVMRFQQLTGPVMAKGVEDTAFYNFNRLVSLNEVGGNPSVFGMDLPTFHRHTLERASLWPQTLLATATHDTKRGEDVRARLNVLSEMPEEWRQAINRWSRLNAAHKSMVNGEAAPDANDEYLLYQTLVGAWPWESARGEELASLRERVSAYMLKAVREAKRRTSWTEPKVAYEQATSEFVAQLLDTSNPNPFLVDLRAFQQRVACFGRFNSLSQVLLKMTLPGVPDFYQGTELWDLNLVDPDNRRAVDYELRRRLLADLKDRVPGEMVQSGMFEALLDQSHTGQVKLYVIWRTLQYRHKHKDLFAHGTYLPLSALGAKAEHVCVFARQGSGKEAITVAPRLVFGLAAGVERAPMGPEVWGETFLPIPGASPGERYRNVLTGEVLVAAAPDASLPMSAVLAHFPIALLQKLGSESRP